MLLISCFVEGCILKSGKWTYLMMPRGHGRSQRISLPFYVILILYGREGRFCENVDEEDEETLDRTATLGGQRSGSFELEARGSGFDADSCNSAFETIWRDCIQCTLWFAFCFGCSSSALDLQIRPTICSRTTSTEAMYVLL